MQRQTKRYLLIVSIFSVSIAIWFGLSMMKPSPVKKETVKVDLLVDVMPLVIETVSLTVASQGTVRPRTETILSAEVAGSIVSISRSFIAGGVFGKNEVLMRIDPTNYVVAVDQAEALLEQRQIEYDGAAKLRRQGYRAESEYASAAAALASAKAELVRARRNLERTYIRLPYDGMVRTKETDLGQYVNVGSRVGVVFATDEAEIRLPLTDSDLAFVDLPDARGISGTNSTNGPKVTLTAVQKGQTMTWYGRIVRSEGVVDEKTRVTYAVVRIEDPYQLSAAASAAPPLPMGTFVAATIAGKRMQNVLRIPRSALRGNGQVIVVDDNSLVQIRSVDILRADADYAYLLGGAIEGERLCLTAIENPVNGMRVRTSDEHDDQAITASGVGG